MFHVNPTTGNVSKCSAKAGKCPFGNADDHFTTSDAARNSYEESQKAKPKITGVVVTDGAVVYDILQINASHAIASIEKANKRLASAGVEQRFTYSMEEYMKPNNESSSKVGFFTPRVKIILNTPAVKFDGYTFLAAVEQAEAGFVVKQATGINLGGYRPDNLECDACGRSIRRQKTYLVEDSEGKMLQVGSGCIKKYFGVQPEGIWALTFDPVEKAEDSVRWYSGSISALGSAVPTEEVMAYALAISNGGEDFVSKGAAYNYGGLSTSERVQDAMNSDDSGEIQVAAKAYIDNGEAKRLIEELQKSDTSSDYGKNMAVISTGEYTRWSDMAILISGLSKIANEKRNLSKAQKLAEWGVPTKGYAGAEKESIAGREFKIRDVVDSTKADPYSYHGGEITTSRVNFRDADNHEIIWWSSNKFTGEIGKKVTIKSGTIKAHGEFAGVDQTVITRVKFDQAD